MKKYLMISVLLSIMYVFCFATDIRKAIIEFPLTASYYHDKFNGKKCANGSTFRNSKITAASNLFPLNSKVRVTNINNGKEVIVTITDRIHPKYTNKRIDLSKEAFKAIGNLKTGLLTVNVSSYADSIITDRKLEEKWTTNRTL